MTTQNLDTAALMLDALVDALSAHPVIAAEVTGVGNRVWRHDARSQKGSDEVTFGLPALVVRLTGDELDPTPGEHLDSREVDSVLVLPVRDGYVEANLEVWVYAATRGQLSRLLGALFETVRPLDTSRGVARDLVVPIDDEVSSPARFMLGSGAERSPAVIDEGYTARRVEVTASGSRIRLMPVTTKDTITLTTTTTEASP